MPAGPSHATTSAVAAYDFADGAFRVDLATRTLWHRGQGIPLPSRAFDALVYLVEHRHRLVGKNELIEAIWRDVVVTDDSLVHAISVLRRALADEPNQPHYVQTVARRGYRFVAPVRVVLEDEPPAVTAPVAKAPPVADARAPDVAPAAPPAQARPPRRNRRIVAGAIAAALALASAAGWYLASQPRAGNGAPTQGLTREIRLFQPPPEGATIVSGGVLSYDGSSLAFVARNDASGTTELWVRALHSADLETLKGTEGASKPFWSPDSRRLGFFANGKLMTVDTVSRETRMVADGGIAVAGGTWAADDTILFADWTKGIFSVKASGGEPTEVVALDRAAQDIVLSWPQFLPDGRHFLYHVVSLDKTRTGAYVGDLDTRRSIRLIHTDSPAVFAPPRHILHIERELLIAEEFDARSLELTGRATVLARDVSPPSLANENVVSAAGDLLAYRSGVQQQLTWLDRTGEVVGTVSMPAVMFNPRVSPDGSRLLATSSVATNPGLWLASLSRAEFERVETDAIGPLWSPDGNRIAYTARGGYDLLIRPAAGGPAKALISGGAIKILNDWSPSGDHIVYTQATDGSKMDLWGVQLADGSAFPILATPFNEMQARISPDAKWIAYASDESGALEVYVQSYPSLGERYKVSDGGGGQPQWRRDQQEIFYIAADGTLVAVPVAPSRPPAFGKPRRLFRAPVSGGPDNARDYYAAAADGGKFLVDGAISTARDNGITVVVHWPAAGGPDPHRLE
jgi:DNA-binding winged helix-turn-helix (wHTH) protein